MSVQEEVLAETPTEEVTVEKKSLKYDSSVTLVTGLWDIGRGELSEGWSRSFDHYLKNPALLYFQFLF